MYVVVYIILVPGNLSSQGVLLIPAVLSGNYRPLPVDPKRVMRDQPSHCPGNLPVYAMAHNTWAHAHVNVLSCCYTWYIACCFLFVNDLY